MNHPPTNPDLEAEFNQDLSALLDGELDGERSRFLMQRLQHDTELRQRWERWQLFSACLKGEPTQPLPADFAERVLAGLDLDSSLANRDASDPRPTPRQRSLASSRTLRWMGGVALAASVGLAALLLRPPAPEPVASVTRPLQQVEIEPVRIALPAPVVELPIPVHAGVVSAYRSPLRVVAVASTQHPHATFSPFPQPYAIDPELEAYLARQKSGAPAAPRDVFSEHNVYLPTGNDGMAGTVSWSPDDEH